MADLAMARPMLANARPMARNPPLIAFQSFLKKKPDARRDPPRQRRASKIAIGERQRIVENVAVRVQRRLV
jgi:hypothetical protein